MFHREHRSSPLCHAVSEEQKLFFFSTSTDPRKLEHDDQCLISVAHVVVGGDRKTDSSGTTVFHDCSEVPCQVHKDATIPLATNSIKLRQLWHVDH